MAMDHALGELLARLCTDVDLLLRAHQEQLSRSRVEFDQTRAHDVETRRVRLEQSWATWLAGERR